MLLLAGHAAPSPVGFEAALGLFPVLAGRLSASSVVIDVGIVLIVLSEFVRRCSLNQSPWLVVVLESSLDWAIQH
jgi:hypothetical protein